MQNYFEGYYYKHQIGENTVAFIPGTSKTGDFIQIITFEKSFFVPYIGKNTFSKKGINIDINTKDIIVNGEIKYSNLTPIRYDIMGPFKCLPMECRHGIISMHHTLDGTLELNCETIDFTNGIGYIEKDSGTSFPKTYLWLQCNDFKQKCSIMVSIADIPLLGHCFKGCICIVHFLNKEYRFATYLGVKIVCYNNKKVILQQGKFRLEIDIFQNDGHKLFAPNVGEMTRTIHESVSCKARFKFYIKNSLVFDFDSNHASFEFVN